MSGEWWLPYEAAYARGARMHQISPITGACFCWECSPYLRWGGKW